MPEDSNPHSTPARAFHVALFCFGKEGLDFELWSTRFDEENRRCVCECVCAHERITEGGNRSFGSGGMGDRNASQPERDHDEIGSTAALSRTIKGNKEDEKEQVLAQTEDTARLRLMEISQAVPPADGPVDMEDRKHSSEELRPASSPGRPDIDEEIRRKLMSISSSDVVQPLPISGQPVAG